MFWNFEKLDERLLVLFWKGDGMSLFAKFSIKLLFGAITAKKFMETSLGVEESLLTTHRIQK